MKDLAPVSSHNSTHSGILSGWKEIANYFGKGVRTVQRYEHTLSLPVRRPAGKSSGSVLARKSELDRWVQSARLADRSEIPRPAVPRGEAATLRHAIDEMRNLRRQTRQLQADCRTERERLSQKLQLLCSGASRTSAVKVFPIDLEDRKAS